MTIAAITALIEAFHERIESPATTASVSRWAAALEGVRGVSHPCVKDALSLWGMQDQRERGEIHLLDSAASRMWLLQIDELEALSKELHEAQGKPYQLVRAGVDVALVVQAAGQSSAEKREPGRSDKGSAAAGLDVFKKRLAVLRALFQGMPAERTHAQMLADVARTEGFEHFQAIKSQVEKQDILCCPYCGSLGGLSLSGGRRQSTREYRCSRCSNAFALTKTGDDAGEDHDR